MKLLLVVGLAILAYGASAEKVRFDGHQVWSVKIETQQQLELLQKFQRDSKSGYSIWGSPAHIGQFIELVVPPWKLDELKQVVQSHNFKNMIAARNLQELIDNEQPKDLSTPFAWDRYRTVDEIYEWLDEIAANYSQVARTQILGYSYEGRPLKGVKISYGLNRRPTSIFVEANIHSREWITSETTSWIINELLTASGEDVQFLRQFDWYIFPIVNPDGVAYTHTTNRLWRKTRSLHPGSNCYGTDGNRNFNFQWNSGGSSTDPCSETFCGPSPLSEKETQAISGYFSAIAKDVELYLSFHSYGQLLMYPFGNSNTPLTNQKDVEEVSKAAGDALQSVYGTKYDVGNAQKVLYTTSGGSRDWAKGYHNVSFSFTYEMRDTGRNGFILPAAQILPNAQEMWVSLVAMVRKGRELGYFPFESRTA